MQVNYSNITFKAGLTKSMQREINNCDTSKITNLFFKRGINNNLRNNKFIAWASFKCIEIIECLNKKYKLNLCLPKGIFVEDFQRLNIENREAIAFTNFAPARLYMDSDRVIPDKTIFFNEFKEQNYSKGNKTWENFDKIADINFEIGLASTDFYLETFLHEFFHVIHENNLMGKLSPDTLIKTLQEILSPAYLKAFQLKYKHEFDYICKYAATGPLETIACDLSKRCIENLNKNILLPEKNFIINSPYSQNTFISFIYSLNKDHKLKNFWNGKFNY